MTKKELLEMLKDPEVSQALDSNSDKKLAGLLKGIEIGDEDTIQTISAKSQKQLADVVKYFSERLESVKKQAVEEATAPAKRKADREINDFAAKNPGMKNKEVVAMMQPLYDKGESLVQCYAKACRALELDPVTGKTAEEAKGDKEADKEKPKKEAPTSSAKSDLSGDTDGDDIPDEEKDKSPKSLDEAISANMNEFEAKHGNPFKE